jgi:hypothetical protein
MGHATAGPDDRLRAACALLVPEVRDSAGRHEYDGVLPDLSPDAVRSALDRLGGAPLDDPHDEAHLAAVEQRLRVEYGQVALHRRTPRRLLASLDLSVYDKPSAAEAERAQARRQHLAGWPEAIDAALPSLDAVSAPAAEALLPAVVGAAQAVVPDEPGGRQALAAHARLVGHLELCARHGDPDPAIGSAMLTALLGAGEARPVELDALACTADTERDRLRAMLDEACSRVRPDVPTETVVAELVDDAPETAEQVLEQARRLTAEVIAFSRERELTPHLDGECLVLPSPPSRRWATAMLSWAAPYEPDGPSVFGITPPDPTWSARRQRQWLRSASPTTLPSTTAHEVAPGHFAHGRSLRRVQGDVRRTLHSSAFVEGWAHDAEELMVEEGFRADDPRFVVGVALKALMRVVRLSVSLDLHAGDLSPDDATRRFEQEAFLQGPAARGEALRAIHDPTYGRYTLGKLAVRDLRDRARRRWGGRYSHLRFATAVLALGAPPLGLLPTAIERG